MFETLFSFASALALVGWVALLFAPLNRRATVAIARWVAALLAGLYVTLIARGLLVGPGPPAGAGFGSLAAVALLFAAPGAVLGGWVHYLAFDLFVGAWETADAPAGNIPHWLLLPCLALTFVSGPAGLLLYLLLRAALSRRATS